MRMIYFDHNSTTPVHPKALEEMLPFLKEEWGNPSSRHEMGYRARDALETARERTARLINADKKQIIFTGSGTEANNLIFNSIVRQNRPEEGQIIISAVEHPSVLETAVYFESQGYKITKVGVDRSGVILLDDLRQALEEKTVFISIMHANNETGSIQPIAEIARLAEKRNVFLHTDAVQSAGKIPLDVSRISIGALTFSAHKINGPKGAGALFISDPLKLTPQILGGGQENGKRSGTENVAGIAGFGKAAELAQANTEKFKRIERLRDLLEDGIVRQVENCRVNAAGAARIPNTSSISFYFTEGDALAAALNEAGLAVSTGSACSSREFKYSHVLPAMGQPAEYYQGAIRFSLGLENTEEEIEKAVEIVKKTVGQVRAVSALYWDLANKREKG